MAPKIEYRIKLMSGNNVVLLEANGYESEIFMPQVVSGRLTFLNIIPNRRCCQLVTEGGKKSFRSNVKTEMSSVTQSQLSKLGRYSGGHDKENGSPSLGPLAMSTPAGVIKQSMGSIRIKQGTSTMVTPSLGWDSTLLTPEPVRKAAPVRKELEIDNNMFHIPRGLKVARLYHNSSDGTPRKVGRLVSITNGGSVTQQELHNLSHVTDFSCSFRVPSTPSVANSKQNRVVSSTPLNKRPAAEANQQRSIGKWRKCLTPKRTYSRRGNHAVPKHNKSMKSVKKNPKPSYLVNPTKAPEPSHKVELKRKRLKVDEQVRIPSKVLKRQQQPVATNVASSNSQTESIRKSLNQMCKAPTSAFDLLTNSNRSRHISTRLNDQFRKGCINKASSTYAKYKLLSSIPPLLQDEQILEITRAQDESYDQSVEQIAGGSTAVENAKACGVTQMVSRSTSTMLFVPVTGAPGSSKHMPQPLRKATQKERPVKQTFRYLKPSQQSTPINSDSQAKNRSSTAHYVLKF